MMGRKIPIYIAVLDYRNSSVKLYTVLMPKKYTCDDIINWLNDNTDYSDSNCYHMYSETPINISQEYSSL